MTRRPWFRVPRMCVVSLMGLIGLACREVTSTTTPYVPPVTPDEPPAPSVTSLAPGLGSTGGGAVLKITGASLATVSRTGTTTVTVMLGGIPVEASNAAGGGTVLYAVAPAHEAGTVDLVVTDARGRTAVLSSAFTYASPESFEFDGEWYQFLGDYHDIFFGFKVVEGALASITCGNLTLALSPPMSIRRGEFAYRGEDGISATARIVAETQVRASVKAGPCSADGIYMNR
jgi:hypothetical protein